MARYPPVVDKRNLKKGSQHLPLQLHLNTLHSYEIRLLSWRKNAECHFNSSSNIDNTSHTVADMLWLFVVSCMWNTKMCSLVFCTPVTHLMVNDIDYEWAGICKQMTTSTTKMNVIQIVSFSPEKGFRWATKRGEAQSITLLIRTRQIRCGSGNLVYSKLSHWSRFLKTIQ